VGNVLIWVVSGKSANLRVMTFSVKALASPFCSLSRATAQCIHHFEGSGSDVARIHQPMA
jgi:hypothetical protein